MLLTVDLATIRAAHDRIKPFVHRTPVLTCSAIDAMIGAELYFKCENFQKVGAFKFRGATNAVQCLSEEEAARGVVTHSSGNHAAALALAARMRGIVAHIVMPDNVPKIKKEAVAGYGGRITYCAPTLAARESTTAAIQADTGAVLVHPYDDLRVIAGQGTAAIELLEEIPELDAVMAPVGGGGLLSGTAIAVKESNAKIKVIGCEPANADDAFQSMREGRIVPARTPNTIADGLLTSLGAHTFPVIQKYVDEIALAEESEILNAQRTIIQRMKILVEPSCSVPLAVLFSGAVKLAGKKIGIILSGGNVELSRLATW